jgi:hypothetical protein
MTKIFFVCVNIDQWVIKNEYILQNPFVYIVLSWFSLFFGLKFANQNIMKIFVEFCFTGTSFYKHLLFRIRLPICTFKCFMICFVKFEQQFYDWFFLSPILRSTFQSKITNSGWDRPFCSAHPILLFPNCPIQMGLLS